MIDPGFQKVGEFDLFFSTGRDINQLNVTDPDFGIFLNEGK
jgi:hypothetical protein